MLIVIVGIFLGLQVQTWYEALEDRRQEAFYLALLHDEVEQIETKFKNYFPNINGRVEVLASLREQYNQNEQFVEISNIQCNAIIVSHIHTNFISTVTTIDELESTGRSQIIENPSIRRLMAVLKSNQNFSNTFIAGLRGDAVNLAAKFPEFIDVNTFTTLAVVMNSMPQSAIIVKFQHLTKQSTIRTASSPMRLVIVHIIVLSLINSKAW